MDLLERIRSGRFVPDSDPPLASPGRRLTLRETGARVGSGEDPLFAIREFLDQAWRADDVTLAAMIDERPELKGNIRADALLGGVAEHLTAVRGMRAPTWTTEPERFLDRFWFVSTVPGLRATALAQTPVALKRRGIFWPARSLQRV